MRLAESPTEALEILDDDGPASRLAVARKLVPEGLTAATEVTVTRNTPPDAALAVVLAASDATEARAPAGITLPIGKPPPPSRWKASRTACRTGTRP